MEKREFEERIYNEWNKFIQNGEIDREIVRPEIEEGWVRCRRQRIDPFGGECRQVLSGVELQQHLKTNKDLVDSAKPFLDSLYAFLRGFGYFIMLTDPSGVILEFFGEQVMKKEALLLNYKKGACWAEKYVGSTTIGTVMHTKEPIQMTGAEHFCSKSHRFTCSAAPIFDENSNMVGIINVSGPKHSAHKHTLGMVVSCAESIHYLLTVNKRNLELMNIFNTVSEAIIVIDKDYKIERINKKAKALMGQKVLEGTCLCDYIAGSKKAVRHVKDTQFIFQQLELAIKSKGKLVHCLMTSDLIGEDPKQGRTVVIKPMEQVRDLAGKFSGASAQLHFDNIVTADDTLQEVISVAQMAAKGEANILLEGESGTGKEVFAQAIHNYSSRKNQPFVAVNCGAIPRDLISSELFGYVDGAFTGAAKGGKPGKFEMADGGTLFLDEIGDMPFEQQVSLLRVLQERKVVRIGGNEEIPSNVRIICASNKSIKREVDYGNFRQDLFYRLNVIFIQIPPLRKRRGDIMLLFNYFMEQKCEKLGRESKKCTQQCRSLLESYSWPGNIRELQNIVERMVYTCEQEALTSDFLPDEIKSAVKRSEMEEKAVQEEADPGLNHVRVQREKYSENQEKQWLQETIIEYHGNVSQAAKALNMSRSTLYRKLKKYKLF